MGEYPKGRAARPQICTIAGDYGVARIASGDDDARMEPRAPSQILKSLVEGVNPSSGEPLTGASVLQHPEVQRALLAGIAALEEDAARAARRSQLPGNLGRPWTEGEERELAQAFKSGESLQAIAERHARSLGAIEARLERLGLLAPEQRVTRSRYSTNAPR